MTKQTEAMKLALDWLEWFSRAWEYEPPMSSYQVERALREALAEQPAQPATYTCGVCGVSMQMEQPAIKQDLTPEQPAQHQCKFPMCQSEEYQQVLAEQIKRELYTGEPAQQEPVAWMYEQARYGSTDLRGQQWKLELSRLRPWEGNVLVRNVQPLYTSPPAQRTWVGLTDEEIESINVRLAGSRDLARLFARAIEAAHGIKGDA